MSAYPLCTEINRCSDKDDDDDDDDRSGCSLSLT
jgi:hypothetical protein